VSSSKLSCAPTNEYTSVSAVSSSVATAEPTLAPPPLFSSMASAKSASTGASFTFSTFTCTVALPLNAPLSVAVTTSAYCGFASWFSTAVATLICAVAAWIWNAPPALSPLRLYASASPSSTSLAATTAASPPDSTCVFTPLFSAMSNACELATTGASFTSVTEIDSVAVSLSPSAPLSTALTVSVYDASASWFSTALATVTCPVDGLISNTPPPLPESMANACDCPLSWSNTDSAPPTGDPAAEFSATARTASANTGASFTFSSVTVTAAVVNSPPESVARTVSV
jgi:hypothetical protein